MIGVTPKITVNIYILTSYLPNFGLEKILFFEFQKILNLLDPCPAPDPP